MIKKLHLPLLMALVVAFASCGKPELKPEYFTTNPQVLEAVAGKVPVTINGTFPEKFLKKKGVIKVTPVLKWNGGEAKGDVFTYQGEKVEGNNPTISYKMGGNVTMKTTFNYIPEMAKSELWLEFDAKFGKKTVDIPAIKIADGVVSTSELVNKTVATANTADSKDKFQRIIAQEKEANIMFLIQQANLRSSELNSDQIKEFNQTVSDVYADKKGKKINNIEISAYASPDGGVKLNTGLSENREENTVKYVNKQLKKAEVEAAVESNATAQDWEGFQELVSASDIQDKELILRVLSMYQDPEQRETEIKNISSVYKTLADEILPQLRRSRLTLNYDLIGKSDEEIMQFVDSDPKQLNVEELLYAGTLTNDNAKREKIYKLAVSQYPNDYRAYNNLCEVYYQNGNYDQAESYGKKAANINGNAPEVNMNLGLVALAKGDKATAEACFGKASGAENLNEAMGNLYIAQGQYERAVNAFGDAKTNSAALAQILAKDYNKAKSTLSAVETPDAYTDYLMAIVGARTNNSTMVTNSLSSAVKKDAALAKYAETDIEFAKYDISGIVK